MATNTVAQDAWVTDTLGVDPRTYPGTRPAAGSASPANGPPAQSGNPQRGNDPPPAHAAPHAAAKTSGAKPAGKATPADGPKGKYEAQLKSIQGRATAVAADLTSGELGRIKAECIDPAKALADGGTHDYAGAMALLDKAAKRLDVVELHKRRYEAGLKVAQDGHAGLAANATAAAAIWAGWGAAPIVGVTAAIPEIKTKFLDTGIAKAATGDYSGAMLLLDGATAPVSAAWAKVNAFAAFATRRNLVGLTFDSTVTAAGLPSLTTALAAIKADTLDKAVVSAKAGDFDTAIATLDAAASRLQPLVDVVTKRSAAATAVAGLAAPELATDKARMQKDRLDAADVLITGGNLSGAGELLVKAAGEAPTIGAYGAALAAAQAALVKLSQPEIAKDAARIKTDCVDPAKARATAWDYAGATVMLKQALAQATEAGKLAAAGAQAEAANTKAQGKAAKNPAGALADVKKLLADLEKLPVAGTIGPQLATIHADIKTADDALAAKTPDPAREAIAKAGKGIVEARMQGERNAQYDAALAAAKTRVAGLPPEAAPEKTAVDTATLQPAIAKFTANDREAGMKLLAGIEPACAAADATAVQSRLYAAALPPAEAALATLTDAFVAPDAAQIKTTMIDAAKARATARDFPGGLKLLAGVVAACASVKSIATANTDTKAAMADLTANQGKVNNNIGYGTSKGLPVRADFTARAAELATKYVNPVNAKLTGRGIGPAGLPAMQAALALAKEGAAASNTLLNDTYYYVAATDEAKAAKDAIAALKAHTGHTAVAKEIANLDKLAADGAALLAAGQNASAVSAYRDVKSGAATATTTADDAVKYTGALIVAKLRMGVCRLAVANSAPIPPLVAALAKAEAETITAAQAKEATHDFTDGTKLLDQVGPRCAEVEAMVAQQMKFATDLAAIEAKLAKLTQPTVAEDVKRIRAERLEPATTAAAANDTKTALDLLTKATAEADQTAKIAAGAQEAQTARDGAQGALDGADLPAAIAAVQKLLDGLLAHPQAASIKDMTDHIAAAIKAARKTPAPKGTKDKLKEAADLCVKARTAADRETAYAAALADIQSQLAALVAPVVATDKAKIQKDRVEAAKKLAGPKTRDFAQALGLLDKARDECAAARDIAARDAAYQAALTAAQATLDALGAITPKDPAIGDDAIAVQNDAINAAKALVPKRDYDGALKLLASVGPSCKTLALKRKMAANTPPTKAEIAAIMSQPGGAAQLDKMVDSLSDATPSAVMQAAIEARFGIDSFKNLTSTGDADPAAIGRSTTKSLKKIYALMSKVPQQNVQNNPSLKEIAVYGGKASDKPNQDRGSYYSGDKKQIVLSCGRAEDTNPQPLAGTPLALPDVEPDCEMVPDSAVPPPKYFDWTTLHEVGHAIDDKTHFMERRLGNAGFGGWQVHGGDLAPIARAVAGACKLAGAVGEAYLSAYLAGAKPPQPPAPAGRADWAAALKSAEEWCDAIRVGKQLWDSGSGSNSRAIGGRVYHEAYGGSWVSYDLAARSKGISGYQFRAPGEWLSELYAAFHSKKLKPTHPAITWLQTL